MPVEAGIRGLPHSQLEGARTMTTARASRRCRVSRRRFQMGHVAMAATRARKDRDRAEEEVEHREIREPRTRRDGSRDRQRHRAEAEVCQGRPLLARQEPRERDGEQPHHTKEGRRHRGSP